MFKLVHFPEANLIIAKDQPEYQPIPAYVCPADRSGTVAFKWKLGWKDRLRVLFTGALWHEVLTFGHPLQPQRIGCGKPEYIAKIGRTKSPSRRQGEDHG